MTTFTQASQIAEFLTERMQDITIENGYLTDIGRNQHRGRLRADNDEVPYSVLLEGEDAPGGNAGRDSLMIEQDYLLGGYTACDPLNPNDAAHKILKDLKRCVFDVPAEDGRMLGGLYTLGGRVKKVNYLNRKIGPRADGNAVVFAMIFISVEFAETLANP